ncbi:hypothetical protein CcaverHIS631_0311970 [Cutaneotrichosporon cavernicola]|nr:hypothetical protein CcaverHIS631_0311970 [Cutaneotrichosporon cavernicola]BEJ06671.1 hypothetical protein CcaverHIS641_0311930 [Cutaneotrichosporon cavernicola]
MATAPTLFTLPLHLRANIAALLAAEIAPPHLQDELSAAIAAADVEEMESDIEPEPESSDDEKGGDGVDKPAPTRKPPTIDGEILDRVAAWASSKHERLTSAGLDYSYIGLLAGTQVYLAPRQRNLALAADKALADKEKVRVQYS